MINDLTSIDIIDIAYQIIDLHKENISLRNELAHYKELYKMHCDTLKSVDKHQKEMIGTILSAAIDPNSTMNKGV